MNTSMELIEKIHDLMEGYLEDYKPPAYRVDHWRQPDTYCRPKRKTNDEKIQHSSLAA